MIINQRKKCKKKQKQQLTFQTNKKPTTNQKKRKKRKTILKTKHTQDQLSAKSVYQQTAAKHKVNSQQ